MTVKSTGRLHLIARVAVAFALAALLAPSMATASDPQASASIHVLMPRTHDEGRFERTLDARPISNVTFAWGLSEFPDAWGRTTHGSRVAFDHAAGAACSASIDLPTGSLGSGNADGLPLFANYGSVPQPIAMGRPAACVAGAAVSAERGVMLGASDTIIVDHGMWTNITCAFRHALQGTDVVAHSVIQDLCAPLGAVWTAGDITVLRGFRALPLEHVDGDTLVRVWLADGLAYPLEVDATSPTTNSTTTLVALRASGEPIPLPTPLGPLRDGFRALDPLLGPDDADAALPLRLSEAARAATSDPTLLEMRALLERKGVALAGATMLMRANVAEWTLVYAAPDAANVAVTCRGTSPLARCRSGADAAQQTKAGAPPASFGAGNLPSTAATFSMALDRWHAVDANASQDAVQLVTYRAWSAQTSAARWEVGFAGEPGVGAAAGKPESRASIALDDGRSLTFVTQRASPIRGPPLPAGLPPPPGYEPNAQPHVGIALPTNAPVGIVTAVAAAGALALILFLTKGAFAALFSRLRGSQVLDSQSRQRILDIVRDEPGVHGARVADRLGAANGVVEHHLAVLVREGFLTRIDSPGFRRFFVTGRFSHNEMRALAALRDGQNEKLYRLIEAHPGIHLSELAQRADLSLAYASRTVKKLQEAGLVDRVQVGRTVTLHAIER